MRLGTVVIKCNLLISYRCIPGTYTQFGMYLPYGRGTNVYACTVNII